MDGRLYYSPNLLWSGSSELLTAVDLRTGELLWETNTTGVGQASFGYYYNFDSPNQHGITSPGWLFTNNFARSYHPLRGFVTGLNITNVPNGFEVVANNGENLRYVLSNTGTSSNPKWMLAQWNSSRVLTDGVMSAYVSGGLIGNSKHILERIGMGAYGSNNLVLRLVLQHTFKHRHHLSNKSKL
jgi:hypothetical protein